ncbi:cell envelope integrity TolA C-terminal domain-containing protein [Erwinia billingiae]|uniref:cell envelope integrity TolA C-terminal domain-containing protein n=1 Tax=Erwinia billingiae TaxID=182337 RepID=UPI003207CA18
MKMNRHKMAWALAATVMTTLLAGCQSAKNTQQNAPATAQEMQAFADQQCTAATAEMSEEYCRYYAKMQYGIQRNFYDHARYVGRECVLTISWKQNGRYSVLSTSGDEQLCKKAWGVVSSAENLPAPPKKFPSEIILDFKPAA